MPARQWVWVWLSLVFIFPVVVLGLALGGSNIPETTLLLALVTVGCSLVLWSMAHLRFRYPLYLIFLYPISVFLWVLMAARSMIMTIAGQNIWKGRRLDIMNETVKTMEESEELKKAEEKIP